MNTLDTQIGGTHYTDLKSQPLDLIARKAVELLVAQIEGSGPSPGDADGDSLPGRARELARRLTGLVEPVLAAPAAGAAPAEQREAVTRSRGA